MRVSQLDAFLQAMEELPAIKWKGTRAKQTPVNCMKHSARKATAPITLQHVMETEMMFLCKPAGAHGGGNPEREVGAPHPSLLDHQCAPSLPTSSSRELGPVPSLGLWCCSWGPWPATPSQSAGLGHTASGTCVSGLRPVPHAPGGHSGSWSTGHQLSGDVCAVWGGVGLEKGVAESLLTSAHHLHLCFLCSVQRAHPADPSYQQSDQDPLPHCQEDTGVSCQRPPVPISALLAGTAALTVQVEGPCPGACGLSTWKCLLHSLLAGKGANFPV